MADRRPTWTDLVLTALLVLFGLLGTGPAAANQGQTAPVASYVLVVAACLPVAVWRRRPMWTFILTGTATMVYLALGYAYGPILFALTVAIYGWTVRSPVRVAVSGMAALLAAGVTAVGIGVVTGERGWAEFVSVAAWLTIPAAVGVAVKARRDAAARVRAEQARRAISEERLRLAQEVHDVVGHGLAVIAMQSGVALRMLERDPARARAAVEAIRTTSREALDGLRAEVEALRRGPQRSDASQPSDPPLQSGAPPRSDAPLRPGSGLADLPGLVERIRSSGLPIAVEVDDGARGLPAEVDRAAYRIVQESLTNLLRHGGPGATAQVRIARDAGALHVDVLDSGRGNEGAEPAGYASTGGRHGIGGMRARAEALGGTLDAGPRAGGGFAVRARLPIVTGTPTANALAPEAPAAGEPA